MTRAIKIFKAVSKLPSGRLASYNLTNMERDTEALDPYQVIYTPGKKTGPNKEFLGTPLFAWAQKPVENPAQFEIWECRATGVREFVHLPGVNIYEARSLGALKAVWKNWKTRTRKPGKGYRGMLLCESITLIRKINA